MAPLLWPSLSAACRVRAQAVGAPWVAAPLGAALRLCSSLAVLQWRYLARVGAALPLAPGFVPWMMRPEVQSDAPRACVLRDVFVLPRYCVVVDLAPTSLMGNQVAWHRA